MSEEFKFSDPGEGLQEAEVLEIHVEEGTRVSDGDMLFTVETDKASTELPSPFSGMVEKVHVNVGDTVRVDDLMLTYTPEGEEADTEQPADEKKREEKEEKTEEKSDAPDRAKESGGKKAEEVSEESEARETEGEEGEQEKGKEGKEEEAAKEQASQGAKKVSQSRSRKAPVPAAPSTRRIAHERGVDLHDVEPSGPHGRVTTEDVEAYASGKGARRAEPEGEATEAAAPTRPSELPDFSRWGETEREPMRSIRRVTAERMAQSWREVPHVFHQDVADVTELERFRQAYAESAEAEGGKFTLTLLVMKAMVHAMKRFPRFNASLDSANQEIVLKRYYNVGMAVATDRGLLVPVIRDVDRKSLIELTREVTETVEKAREGELGREEMEGGSMTLTNPGPLGGTSLSPIINQPEVAILGLGQARLEPVVHGTLDDYEIKPRLLLPLSLGFDHRVNDGADAAQFVTTLIKALQDPQSLMLRL